MTSSACLYTIQLKQQNMIVTSECSDILSLVLWILKKDLIWLPHIRGNHSSNFGIFHFLVLFYSFALHLYP